MIDLIEAQDIARAQVKQIIDSDPELIESEVEQVRLERETESTWTFVADIPKLIREGWVPGAITIIINKLDGHVLTEAEQTNFHKNRENARRAGFIRQP